MPFQGGLLWYTILCGPRRQSGKWLSDFCLSAIFEEGYNKKIIEKPTPNRSASMKRHIIIILRLRDNKTSSLLTKLNALAVSKRDKEYI